MESSIQGLLIYCAYTVEQLKGHVEQLKGHEEQLKGHED